MVIAESLAQVTQPLATIGDGRPPPSKRRSYQKSLTLFRRSWKLASVALRRATARPRRAFLYAAFNPLRIDFTVRRFKVHLSRRPGAFNVHGSLFAPILLFTLLNHLAKTSRIAVRMRANAAGARRLPDLTVSFSIVCTLTCESRIGDIR